MASSYIVVSKDTQIDLSEFTIDLAIQKRAGFSKENNKTIDQYVEDMKRGVKFPAVIAFQDEKHRLFLASGFHRHGAAEKKGDTTILTTIYKGTKEDAEWFACSTNATHGLQRTNDDKRKAVDAAIRLKPAMSDREIGAHCGVSHTFVASVRKGLESKGEVAKTETRTGKDGREQSVAKRTTAPASKPAQQAQPAPAPAAEPAVEADSSDATEVEEPAAPAPAPTVHPANAPVGIPGSKDAEGNDVPELLHPVFAVVQQFHAAVRGLRGAGNFWKAMAASPAGSFMAADDADLLLSMADNLEAATPWKVNSEFATGWEPKDLTKCGTGQQHAPNEEVVEG